MSLYNKCVCVCVCMLLSSYRSFYFEAYFMIHWLFFPNSKKINNKEGKKEEKKLKMLIAGLYYQDPNHPYNLFDMMK